MPKVKKYIQRLRLIGKKGRKRKPSVETQESETTRQKSLSMEDLAQKSIMGDATLSNTSKKRVEPLATSTGDKKRMCVSKPEVEKKRIATDEASNEAKKKRGHPKGPGKNAVKKSSPKKGGTGRRGRPKKRAAEEQTEDSAEEPAEESAQESAEESAEEPGEKVSKKAAKEPAEEADKE